MCLARLPINFDSISKYHIVRKIVCIQCHYVYVFPHAYIHTYNTCVPTVNIHLLHDYTNLASMYCISSKYCYYLYVPSARRQGFRACPGKLQRTGKPGNWKNELRCHKIDLYYKKKKYKTYKTYIDTVCAPIIVIRDALHYLDVLTLQRFMRNDAEIMNRKETGLCAKCQRRVSLFFISLCRCRCT